MQELWYWMLLGILPYHFVWHTHIHHYGLIEIQAIAWHVRLMHQSPGSYQIQISLPLIQKLWVVFGVAIRRARSQRPTDDLDVPTS